MADQLNEFDECLAKIDDRRRVAAIEAYWDGDPVGWGISLVSILEQPSLHHPRFKELSLKFFREPSGDMRLFDQAEPAWPEIDQARSLGKRLADELGVPLYGPPEGEPSPEHPRWWDIDGRKPEERRWDVRWRAVAVFDGGGGEEHAGTLETIAALPADALDKALQAAVEHDRKPNELRRRCVAQTRVDAQTLSWGQETVFRVPCPQEGIELLRTAATGERRWSEVLRELIEGHGIARDDLALVVLDNVELKSKGKKLTQMHEWAHGFIDDDALDDGLSRR